VTEQRTAGGCWFARIRERRRVERQRAREHERVTQEDIGGLLLAYPVEADRSPYASSDEAARNGRWSGGGFWGGGGGDGGGGGCGGDGGGC